MDRWNTPRNRVANAAVRKAPDEVSVPCHRS